MEKTGDKIYFLGRVIERTARGYSVEANPKYIRNVINVLGLEEAKPVMTPSVKRTSTTELLVELEGERRVMYRTVVGKLLVVASRRHVQREGNSKKNQMSNRERRDESETCHEILERRSECKEPDRNLNTFKVRERENRQRLGRTSYNLQERAQVTELCSGEMQHSQHGQEHSKQ